MSIHMYVQVVIVQCKNHGAIRYLSNTVISGSVQTFLKFNEEDDYHALDYDGLGRNELSNKKTLACCWNPRLCQFKSPILLLIPVLLVESFEYVFYSYITNSNSMLLLLYSSFPWLMSLFLRGRACRPGAFAVHLAAWRSFLGRLGGKKTHQMLKWGWANYLSILVGWTWDSWDEHPFTGYSDLFWGSSGARVFDP